ncbi:MAG: hypothetical protein H7329_03130 [Opitutaceae bacterium]|nr:hypothetical protein [Cytophagales bacterium]
MNKYLVKLIILSIFSLVLASCGSKYNKLKFKDPNDGDKAIYGDIGGEPLTVTTPSKPDPLVGEISKPNAGKFREQIEATIQH